MVAGKEQEGNKFADYFDYREPIRRIPSHRALALFRGRNQGVLALELLSGEGEDPDATCRAMIAARFGVRHQGRPADEWLAETVRKAWRVKLLTRLELDLKGQLQQAAEEEAIRVFGLNLKALLLAAPAGACRHSASIPVCAPGSKWRWSTPPGGLRPPIPSTRTRRANNGMPRWRGSRRSPPSTASSSSASATAPRRARPIGSRAS